MVFIGSAIWVYRPVQRANKRLKTSSQRSMHYLEHCITLLPRRALRGFLIAGCCCTFYLLTILSIGTILDHAELTAAMLLSLFLTLIYGIGLLAPAVALAMTMAYAARLRHILSEKGLFQHTLKDDDLIISWSKVSKRPWIIFLITSALPVSILAFFVYLILGTDTATERHFILLQAAILCSSLLVAGTCLTFVIGRIIQRVMGSLTMALKRLQKGQLNESVPILIDDEFGTLARGINMALSGLKEREELKLNLEVATEIHQAMLPQNSLKVPHYQIHAFQQSCHAVGGDYYDHIALTNGELWLIVADVAGKGYPAALTVANLRAMIHVLAHLNLPLEKAADYINASLCETLTSGRFVTLFMAKLDLKQHELRWINAGHLPVLCCANDGEITTLPASAPPMGLRDGLAFPVHYHHLQQGETLLTYSDGITESRQKETNEMFGEQRLRHWFVEHHQLDLSLQVKKLQEKLNKFGTLAADDDVTMLFFQRLKESKDD